MKWKDKLKLGNGERLVLTRSFEVCNLGQEERKYYDVFNAAGIKIGEVTFIEHTDIKAPFYSSFSLKHFDLNRHLLFSEQW